MRWGFSPSSGRLTSSDRPIPGKWSCPRVEVWVELAVREEVCTVGRKGCAFAVAGCRRQWGKVIICLYFSGLGSGGLVSILVRHVQLALWVWLLFSKENQKETR